MGDKTACDYHNTASSLVRHMRILLRDGNCDDALDALRDLEYAIDGIHSGAVSLERRCQAYREAIESLGFRRV